ncbi:MAG: apolipoprotein N-acyltransferase [Bacteroidota bacterium]|nr:apolipoprotein N-acyltransferase [Bacteroidota bacterium]
MPNKHLKALLLALAGGVLLWLGWPPSKFNFILFFAVVPWLMLERHISQNFRQSALSLHLYAYIGTLTWNALTTWWIYYASPEGAVLAIVLNSLLQIIPIVLLQQMNRHKRKIRFAPAIVFIGSWLSIEYLHLNWDAPWPWLNLGNGLATNTDWVQWYQYTGTFGGSLWILIVNFVIYSTLVSVSRKRPYSVAILPILIMLPIIISEFKLGQLDNSSRQEIKVRIVQPNIDPFNTKFNQDSFQSQFIKLLTLTKGSNTKVDLIVWPETSVPDDANWVYGQYKSGKYVNDLTNYLQQNPETKLLVGATTYRLYPNLKDSPSPTARNDGNQWFDIYNSAVLLDSGGIKNIYHKSKLVPGVEKMPYPVVLGFLETMSISLGGSSGSLGSQDTPSIFKIKNNIMTAPLVCYESIFGQHIGQFMQKKANFITIITNDGWWKNTDGYQQHFNYGRLRAIENNSYLIRSANTGISAVIDNKGRVIKSLGWDEKGYIEASIISNNGLSFYAKYGDYIGLIMTILGYSLLLVSRLYNLIKV